MSTIQNIDSKTNDFRINNFDLIRLLAATQVLLLHSFSHLKIAQITIINEIFRFPGVTVFFVVSGFLISRSFERRSSLFTYLRARAFRLFPALWSLIAITIIVYSILGVNFSTLSAVKWAFLQSIGVIYTPGFLKGFGIGSWNGALWTIMVEIQFYLVLPLIYWIGSKFLGINKTLVASCAIFAAISVTLMELFPNLRSSNSLGIEKLIRYSFIPHMYVFLFGACLHRFRVYELRQINGKCVYWLIIYSFASRIFSSTPMIDFINTLILGITVVSCAYSFRTVSSKLLRGTDISYGVYIYHGLVLNVFVSIGFIYESYFIALCGVLAYFLAYSSWKIIEKPFLMRK